MIVFRRLDQNLGRGRPTSFGHDRNTCTLSSPSSERMQRDLGRFRTVKMGRFHWPDAKRLANAGYESVAHVPAVFDSKERYRRELNRYLRERARGVGHPTGSREIPRSRTIESLARAVDHFMEWAEERGVDWRSADYDTVLRYQAEQMSGKAAQDGKPLSPNTANSRADSATHFLSWAAKVGLRPAFEFAEGERTRTYTVRGRRVSKTVLVRAGREKKPRSRGIETLQRLPTLNEVADWLDAVERRRGKAKFLLCRFVLETGVRLEEAVSITLDQWPTAEDIADADRRGYHRVALRLTKTKGGSHRTIEVPLQYAKDVLAWIDGRRMLAVTRWTKRTRGRARDLTRLWVSDSKGHEGTPIERHTLYKCFRGVTPRPRHWYPHMGRHTFACFFMLSFIEREAGGPSHLHERSASWVEERGTLALDILRRQLGHVSEETTHIYLSWLVTASAIADLASAWHDRLSDALARAGGEEDDNA